MLITEDALYQIIDDTWNSTLGFQVERRPGLKPDVAGAMNVRVKIAGAWEGEVRLRCPVGLARLIAAATFQAEAESANQDEILDALSELVHIIGGNLKTLLPPPVTLSLPSLCDPAKGGAEFPSRQLVCELTLQSRGYPFAVALMGGPQVSEQRELHFDFGGPPVCGPPEVT